MEQEIAHETFGDYLMGGTISPYFVMLAPFGMSICLGAIIGRAKWYANWRASFWLKWPLHILAGGLIVALAWLWLFDVASVDKGTSSQSSSSVGPSTVEVFFYFLWPSGIFVYAIFGLISCALSRDFGRAAV